MARSLFGVLNRDDLNARIADTVHDQIRKATQQESASAVKVPCPTVRRRCNSFHRPFQLIGEGSTERRVDFGVPPFGGGSLLDGCGMKLNR
jgi:hypothetical protein